MAPDRPGTVRRNAAGDAVWSDPTASPFFPDSAAVIFDPDRRRVARVPTPRPIPAPEVAVPTTTSPSVGASGVSTESSPAPSAAPVAPAVPPVPPVPAGARPAPPSGSPWSRTDTYATGQLAAPAAVPARQRSISAGRRSEPSAAYQPVTVYRSAPGTLAPPTLDQMRAQQRADGVAPARGLLSRAFDVVRKLAR